MSGKEKILQTILSGRKDHAILFNDLCHLLATLGFACRINGSHHIYYKKGISEILNLQTKGHHAKPYQVKQVRQLILKYRLGDDSDV